VSHVHTCQLLARCKWHFCFKFPDWQSSGPDPSQPILARGRLALSPGPQFGGFARLNLGTSPALVEEAVERPVKANSLLKQ
jgi:bifunctional pyridoxal-dependent enzyme with beta-cystathionase and maltose regulon repressor activities